MHFQSKPAGSLQGETHLKGWLDSPISLRRGKYCPWAISHLMVANLAQGRMLHQDLLFPSWRAEHSQVSPSHFSHSSWSQVTSALLWPFFGGMPGSPAGHSVGRKRGVGPGCIPYPFPLWHISALEGKGMGASPRSQAGKGIEGNTGVLYIQWQ